jgi:hypothetical protein
MELTKMIGALIISLQKNGGIQQAHDYHDIHQDEIDTENVFW